jgi:hypothetical protein
MTATLMATPRVSHGLKKRTSNASDTLGDVGRRLSGDVGVADGDVTASAGMAVGTRL